MGKPGHPGRERDGRAAGGAGRGARQVPGVTRRAEHLVEGMGAGAEFRRVGLGVDDGAIAFEQFDDDV